MKGVILAGGTGSRALHPLTRITNKHLLPVYDKPMIYYPIETLVNAGITDIMVVTGGNHAGEFLRLLGNGREFGLQAPELRLPGAGRRDRRGARAGRDFVDGDKCVVMLGDNILGRVDRAVRRELPAPGARRAGPAQGDGEARAPAAPRRADHRERAHPHRPARSRRIRRRRTR